MPIAVYGKGERGAKLAKTLTGWSKDLFLFTDGPSELDDSSRFFLKEANIRVIEGEIECLIGENGRLSEIRLKNGHRVARAALFFNTPSFVRSKLINSLGCTFSNEEGVYTGKLEETPVPGVYAAGNILRDVQMAIVAAAEGARAAFGISCELIEEDLQARLKPPVRDLGTRVATR